MSTISFGNEVRLSQGVHLETASLDLNSNLPYKHVAKPIVIGDGVWIGAHSIVLGGVSIGKGSVIGAGVVISKDIPANSIIVGPGFRTIERKEKY
ncbi:DapH/DapD/GlmU-related protein [Pseudomonas corrugata]|uniref:DapH/DapD/GlmU-related protein n=1 Tax=Pseudomonas corrugata TaxID=47879 RepID=UPI001930911C|nr:DapH/DapD/GlmU-related protein [Pseudomonas corrugata]